MQLYTTPEAARIMRMSPAWLRQKIFRKEIRYMRIGRRIFIPESTINEIFDRAVVHPRNHEK